MSMKSNILNRHEVHHDKVGRVKVHDEDKDGFTHLINEKDSIAFLAGYQKLNILQSNY